MFGSLNHADCNGGFRVNTIFYIVLCIIKISLFFIGKISELIDIEAYSPVSCMDFSTGDLSNARIIVYIFGFVGLLDD